MENFSTMFEDVRHQRSLILSLTDPDILKQSKVTVDEIEIKKSCSYNIIYTKNIKRASCDGFVRKKNKFLINK